MATISKKNISEASGQISIKFDVIHHLVGDRLHMVLEQIVANLWVPWQQKALINRLCLLVPFNGKSRTILFSETTRPRTSIFCM